MPGLASKTVTVIFEDARVAFPVIETSESVVSATDKLIDSLDIEISKQLRGRSCDPATSLTKQTN